MSGVLLLVVGILILPSLLVVIIPLINNLLNSEFLGYFNDVIFNLNDFIGSNSVNYILIILGLIFFLSFMRFVFRSISVIGHK